MGNLDKDASFKDKRDAWIIKQSARGMELAIMDTSRMSEEEKDIHKLKTMQARISYGSWEYRSGCYKMLDRVVEKLKGGL